MQRETATQAADLPHDFEAYALENRAIVCYLCGGPESDFLHGDVFAPEQASQRPMLRAELGS